MHGPTYQFIRIALAEENSASGAQKSDTCILAGSLTFRFPDQFAMRFWRKVSQKSITGFPTQAGLLFEFTAT
jgi:hypothetical protein